MALDSLVSAFKMGRKHFTHGIIIDDSYIEELQQLPDVIPVGIAYFAGAATRQPLGIASSLYAVGKYALKNTLVELYLKRKH